MKYSLSLGSFMDHATISDMKNMPAPVAPAEIRRIRI
jgi:hypothetical protein